jgi:hypothetical protein
VLAGGTTTLTTTSATNLTVGTFLYAGNRVAVYPFTTSGAYAARRVCNLIGTASVLKIARIHNANLPILEFENWTDTSPPVQQNFWQLSAATTMAFTCRTLATVQIDITPFTIATTGISSFVPLSMEAQNITNIAVPSTTNNTFADLKFDVVNRNWFYKESVYGQFSSNVSQNINNGTETLFTYSTTTNALNCNTQGTPATQIKVSVQGLYKIGISPNVLGGGNHLVSFWLKKNGANVADSGSQITTKSGSDLPFVELFETMNVNDYIEIASTSDSTGQSISAVSAVGIIPAIPSLIVTIQRIN